MLVLTVRSVQRGYYNTVTDIPVLLPSDKQHAEGWSTFQQGIGLQYVRVLTLQDLKSAAKYLSESEAKHFVAVVMLRKALSGTPDRLAISKAMKLFDEAIQLRQAARQQRCDESESERNLQKALGEFARAAASVAGCVYRRNRGA